MKKTIIWLLVFVFIASFSIYGVGCKPAEVIEETVKEAVEDSSEATEKVMEEEAMEPVKITMWYWGEQEGPGLEGWVNESIEMYQTANQHISVEAVLQTTEGLYPAFRTAAEAKQTPDIQYMWSEIWHFEDVWQGNVMDITEYWSDEDLQYMTSPDAGVLGNERYGVSFYFMGYTMVYNKRVLEESGIDAPPVTWDEFIEDCKTIKDHGFTPFSTGLKDNMFAAFIVDGMLPQYLDKISEVLLSTVGDAKWTDTIYSDWWKDLEQLIPYMNEDAASIDILQGIDLFGLGDTAFTYYAYGGIQPLYDILGDDLGLMSFPRIGEGSVFSDTFPASAQQLVVPAYSEHPKEANDFLKFLLSPERANAMYAASGLFPSNTEFDASKARNPFEQIVLDYGMTHSMNNSLNFMPPEVGWGGIATHFTSLYNGDLTADEVAQEVENLSVQWKDSNPDMLENYKGWYDALVSMGK